MAGVRLLEELQTKDLIRSARSSAELRGTVCFGMLNPSIDITYVLANMRGNGGSPPDYSAHLVAVLTIAISDRADRLIFNLPEHILRKRVTMRK